MFALRLLAERREAETGFLVLAAKQGGAWFAHSPIENDGIHYLHNLVSLVRISRGFVKVLRFQLAEAGPAGYKCRYLVFMGRLPTRCGLIPARRFR